MTTIHLTVPIPMPAAAATIGFFDGVHLGHHYLLQQLRRQAEECGLSPMVITFDRHPRQVLQNGWQPQLLTTLEEKKKLLTAEGLDHLVVLPFDRQMASLSATAFMREILQQQLNVRLLLTGYDNHFGCRKADSTEGFNDYVAYGREMGMEVVCGQPLVLDGGSSAVRGKAISSSLIRRLLEEGNVADAAECLGRPYRLTGTVVHGEQQGHRLGFPTANLNLDAPRLVPRNGVYAVKVEGDGMKVTGDGMRVTGDGWKGMTNIGTRPTFDGHRRTIETHIFDFIGNLYGETISLDFMARLRDERPFPSVQELARQMALDAQEARGVLSEL